MRFRVPGFCKRCLRMSLRSACSAVHGRGSLRRLASTTVLLLSATLVYSQDQDIPRTPWGAPNLNGVWDYSSATPLQRLPEYEGKTNFTEAEAQVFLGRQEQELEAAVAAFDGEGNDVGVEVWIPIDAPLTNDLRTSLIVDPADGKIPPLTAEAQARFDAYGAVTMSPPTGPEDRPAYERCIVGFGAGPPIEGFFGYNSLLQIFQSQDTISIMMEMVNDVRTVHLDDRPFLPEYVRQWKGDSRGFWDGDTLVVETRNFTDKTSVYGSGMNMRVTERFTRINETQIEYAYTVSDAESFTAPWSAKIPIRKVADPLFEYACHEANRSMESMLRGARLTDAG